MSVNQVRREFQHRFGTEPMIVSVAPGRVNLIGEHTDYSDGFVFPAAIDRETYVAISPADDASHLYSLQVFEAKPFDARSVQPGQLEDWGRYVAGMAWAFREAGITVPNIRAVVSSTVPMGSGVSSSAALEMAVGVALSVITGASLSPAALAKLGKRCENGFVGVQSGIMDQMASACGRENQAMFLDTRSLEIDYAPIPAELAVVLLDTKKPRALADSAYNERRSQCEAACRAIGVSMLRDASLAQVDAADMDPIVRKRARHVASENDRCIAFRDALVAGDTTLAGALMRASHESLRDDFEVSCDELDAMAESAWNAPGVVGARMTGAGFGGACVALVQREKLAEFEEATLREYSRKSGRNGEAMVCSLVQGARVVEATV